MAIRVVVVSGDYPLKNGISEELSKNKNLEVITTVFSVSQAAGLFDPRRSNALVLDLEGQYVTAEYLKALTEKFPLTVIIVGPHPGTAFIMHGLNNIIAKPIVGNRFSMRSFCENLTWRIDMFTANSASVATLAAVPDAQAVGVGQKIVVMAASTGGTEALPEVLRGLPANMPPMLIVQHMPSMFTKQFAERLDKLSRFSVKEAADGDYLRKGLALLAPGDLHMKLVKKNQKLAVECFMADKLHGVRPAADITFNSVVSICGGNVVGVILTGMGSDGARGLFDLHAKGATVIAQDKDSCVVYGMPKAAVDLGATDYVLPLNKIADVVASLV